MYKRQGIADFVGGIIFAIAGFLKRPRKDFEVKKITVIELAHLGDVLAVTPALNLLRKRFPDASITAVVSPWGRGILEGSPDLDEIVTYRASWFDRIEKERFSLYETISFLRIMRRKRFDLGLDMRGDFRVILLMWLCGIKKRAGYDFAGGKFLLTDIVSIDAEKRQDTHQIDHNLNLVSSIGGGAGVEGHDRTLRIFYSETDLARAEEFLKERGVLKSDFLIAVHLGSGLASKCWPIERFALLIEKLVEKGKTRIVLVGGPEEMPLVEKIGPSPLPKVINAVGKTGVKQLAALLKRCDLFVGGDSAVMHVASAAATPIVAIWGGHNKPSHWMPLGKEDIVIHKKVRCGPCGLKTCDDLKCLKLITVEDVLDALEKQMRRLSKT